MAFGFLRGAAALVGPARFPLAELASEFVHDQIERGEFEPLREWLGEKIHSQGRKYVQQELLRHATGSTIDAKPYLAYLTRKFGAHVAA